MYIYEWNDNRISLKNISANMQHVFTFCDNGPWWIYPSAWDQWKCQFLQHHQTWRCDTATLQSSEIPHMQITTFSKRSASKTCHLFKFIIANTSSQKSEFDFSKTMFANKIVSFTISSISKSPTMVSLLSSLVKDIRRETNFKPFQIVRASLSTHELGLPAGGNPPEPLSRSGRTPRSGLRACWTDGTAPLRAWLSGTVPCPFRAAPPAAPALGIPRLHCSCRDLDTTDASRGLGPARVLSCPPNPILQLAAPAAGGPRGAKHRQGQHLCPLLDASQSWPCARPSWPAHRVCRGGLPPPH